MQENSVENWRKAPIGYFGGLLLHFPLFVAFCHRTIHLETLRASWPQMVTYVLLSFEKNRFLQLFDLVNISRPKDKEAFSDATIQHRR
jgi:hypothetical protein